MPTERRFRMRWASLKVANVGGQSAQTYTEREAIENATVLNRVDAGHFHHWHVDADHAAAPEPVTDGTGMLWS